MIAVHRDFAGQGNGLMRPFDCRIQRYSKVSLIGRLSFQVIQDTIPEVDVKEGLAKGA